MSKPLPPNMAERERLLREKVAANRVKRKEEAAYKLAHPKETKIQKLIAEWLELNGFFAFRVNQQGVPLHDGSGIYRPSPSKGVSDILGCHLGRFYAIEVKRLGEKPTDHQQAFLDRVTEHGGLAFVAHSLNEVKARFIAEGWWVA
jgi:hypothetical protein